MGNHLFINKMRVFSLLLLTGLFGSSTVQAASFFTADASASLVITGISDGGGDLAVKPADLVFVGDTGIFLLDEFATPGASSLADAVLGVSAADPDDMDLGDSVDQAAHAEGSAAPLGTDFVLSTADALTDGFLDIDNLSASETYTVFFDFVWSWSVDSGVDEPLTELAGAFAAVSVGPLDPGLPPFFESLGASDSVLGGGPFSDSGTFSFDLTLAPGEFVDLWVVTDAFGDAAVVPEPGTLVLLASGLAGMVLWRRRVS